MLKRAIALVVVVLVNGTLAYEFNDRSGATTNNEQSYLSDSMSPGIDPPISSYSSHNDYSDTSGPSSDIYSNSLKFYNDPSPLTQYDSSNPSQPSSPLNLTHIRTVRNANGKLADYLKHTTIVAHLINGIAIQNGLMNGKIPINDLVGELLNFGSVAVSDIANFKKDSITSLIDDLKKTKSKLVPTFEKYEAEAVQWNELILTAAGLPDISTLSNDGDSYFKNLETLGKKFNYITFDGPARILKGVKNVLDGVPQMVPKDADYLQLQSLISNLQELVTSLSDFDSAVKALNKYKFQDGPTIFAPIEQSIWIMKKRGSFKFAFNEPEVKGIATNIKEVLQASASSQAAQNDFSIINKLAESRMTPGKNIRKYTYGLPDGLSDVKQLTKDVRDPWIGKIVAISGSNLNGLADGLEPIFGIEKRLSGLDDKLKIITSNDVQNSLNYIKTVQDKLSTLKTNTDGLVKNLFHEIETCDKNSKVNDDTYKVNEAILEEVKLLKSFLNNANSATKGLDLDGIGKKIQSFFDSLGFQDFSKYKNSFSQFGVVLGNLKTKGLAIIQQLLDDISPRFSGITSKVLKGKAETLIGNKTKINHFAGSDVAIKNLHDCLKKLKGVSSDVSNAIATGSDLRKLDPNAITNLEKITTAVSEVSQSLTDVASIPETMKKNAKEVITELNKLPDSLQKSKVVGQSVSSLHTASQLIEFESQIGQLKTIDADVQAEIQKMSSLDDRKKAESQWGAHKKDMDELEKTLAEIKTFGTGIDVSKAKTLGAYGTPLKQLASLPSSNIKAKEKSKALEVLLSQQSQPPIDPSTKSRLEATQKTLEQLSSLDLGFASHSAQYQSAPAAFQALHDFLSKFLAVDHQQTTIVTEEGGVSLVYIGIIVATILIGLAGIILFYCGFWKPREEAKNFIKNNRLINKKRAEIYHIRVHDAMKVFTQQTPKKKNENTKPTKEQTEEEKKAEEEEKKAEEERNYGDIRKERHRYFDTLCNPGTQVKVESLDHGIHANHVTTKSGKKYIATQAPMGNDMPGKMSTLGDFWCMVLQYSSEFVVSLCSDDEMINRNGRGPKCGLYFAKEKGDQVIIENRFAVKTTSKQEILNNNVVKRIVKISDNTNEFPNHTLTHYQYITWPDRGVPTDHETGIALMDLVKKSKKPVVVHCSAGIGRTMSFIGMEYIYEEVLANPGIVWCDAMIKMRDARWHGIQTYVQSIWVLLAVFFKLIRKYKLKSKPYTEDLKIMLEINDDPAAAEAPEAAPAAAPAEAPEAAEAPAAPAAAPRAPAAGENAEGIHEEDENQGQPRNHVIIPIE